MGQKIKQKKRKKETKNKHKSAKKKSIEIKIDKVCDTSWQHAWGLMFSEKKTALFIFKRPQRSAIHTWFMRYPLNLIFLNKGKEVIEISENIQPWSYYKPKNKANYLIERPDDKKAQKIEVKDKIKIRKKDKKINDFFDE